MSLQRIHESLHWISVMGSCCFSCLLSYLWELIIIIASSRLLGFVCSIHSVSRFSYPFLSHQYYNFLAYLHCKILRKNSSKLQVKKVLRWKLQLVILSIYPVSSYSLATKLLNANRRQWLSMNPAIIVEMQKASDLWRGKSYHAHLLFLGYWKTWCAYATARTDG